MKLASFVIGMVVGSIIFWQVSNGECLEDLRLLWPWINIVLGSGFLAALIPMVREVPRRWAIPLLAWWFFVGISLPLSAGCLAS